MVHILKRNTLSLYPAKLINFHLNNIIIFKIFVQFSGTVYFTAPGEHFDIVAAFVIEDEVQRYFRIFFCVLFRIVCMLGLDELLVDFVERFHIQLLDVDQ